MTGSPRRRLAAIAAIGVLALASLSACRQDAGTAAWVGNTRITDVQINQIANSIPGQTDKSAARVSAVTLKVFNTAAAKYAASKGITAPKVTAADVDQVASSQNLTAAQAAAAKPWLQLEAESSAWLSTLTNSVPANTTPTQADLQRLFNELKADFPPGTTLDQAVQTFKQIPGLAQGVALRNQLEPAFKSYDISISPRYANNCTEAPCPGPYVPLVTVQGQAGTIDVVNLPLTGGQASPPAIDLPAAAPTITPQS